LQNVIGSFSKLSGSRQIGQGSSGDISWRTAYSISELNLASISSNYNFEKLFEIKFIFSLREFQIH
jgi:hypothetical protein